MIVADAKRKGEPGDKRYFRASERVFRMNEAWFFAAREGDQGPYPSEPEALVEMQRYIETQTQLKGFQNEREEARRAIAEGGVTELEILPMDRPSMRPAHKPRRQASVMI